MIFDSLECFVKGGCRSNYCFVRSFATVLTGATVLVQFCLGLIRNDGKEIFARFLASRYFLWPNFLFLVKKISVKWYLVGVSEVDLA